MKRTFSLFAALLAAAPLFAQSPTNDDFLCDSMVNLGVAPACPTTVFTNVGATPSNIGFDNNPSCFNSGIAERDVWFRFVCPDTLFDFRITVTGTGANPIENPEFALYRGDCAFDGFAELLCASAELGENELFLDIFGLTPGVEYYIRISDWSPSASPNAGDFTLCVDEIPPIVTIDQGSSALCAGTLYDSGGPDEDYGPNEDYTFTICPTQPSVCITFTLDYYNLEEADVDFAGIDESLIFYDGNSTAAPVIGELSGSGFGAPIGGGGSGVCYQVQATSGCLTVQFQSDETIEFEGWQGHWQCSTEACEVSESIQITPEVPAATIATAVQAEGTTVTVTSIDCDGVGYGTFEYPTANNDLGLQKGLILTSGEALNAIGPNQLPFAGSVLLLDGDPDLDIISELSGNFLQSNDACVVELDVFVATNQLAFEYVFGSDEYPEFVDNDFNDIFAFLISGPGIVGDPGLGTQKNIAVLPGVGAPVEINSVNQLLNWQFYRNNGLGQELEYDGLTSDYLGVKKSLTARSAVVPCNTYHLKLAIADRGDWSYDSGVFVSEIKAGAPDLKVQFAGGLDYFIEDCNAGLDKLVISLSEPATSLTTFTVTIGGSATQGVDYTLVIPSVITFQPGEQTLSFPISPLMDNLVEGTENIAIQLSNDFGCGAVVLKTLNVEIKDNVEVNVTGGDTLQVCAGTTLTLMAKGATTYFWAPPSAVSNPFIANPNITPTQDIWLEVTGTVLNCVDKDSVFIDVINVELDAIALANANICLGASVPLQAVNNVNGEGISWLPIEGLNDPESSTPTATPTFTTTYVATLKVFGCTVVDSVTVKVDTLFAPNVIADTTVCQNYPVQLAEILNTTTEYQWSPSLGLSDANISGPIALPDQTTAYTLTATSANAYCSSTQNVTVSVVASNVDIAGGAYREICLGDTVQLSAQASPSGAAITWSPSFYVSNTSGAGVSAFPDESVTIFATYNINNCLVRDSVRLRVDSLPLLSIRREMDKSIYCPGDTIYLISKTYEPADFPDIQSEWLPFGTQLTPLDDWNMVIIATETHTFQRITVNNACSDTATVEIPVGIPPTFSATVEPPQICIGESAQINITVDPPGTKLMWDMATSSTLSCQDCPNPIATPLMTTTYTVSAPEADCPASTDVVVEVSAAPALDLADNPAICLGDSILLNSTNEPDVTYTWSPTAGLSSPNSGNPSASPSQTTTYALSAQLGNCTVERSVTVTVASATINAGQDETICFGETTTLTATTTGTPGLVTWQPSSQTGNSISVSPSTSQVFEATLIYGPNCVATDEVLVSVPTRLELSDLDATPDPADSLCEGTPVLLKVRAISGQSTSIVWTLNGVAIPGQTLDSLQITPLETPAAYAVVATDANGCTAATEPITYASKRCFAIPNAFTPGNGDDANDTFGPVVFGGQVTLTKFAVYNRWGQKVFEANAQQPRWDGRIGGTDAPVDVYVYHIRARFSNGQEEDFKGEITLLR